MKVKENNWINFNYNRKLPWKCRLIWWRIWLRCSRRRNNRKWYNCRCWRIWRNNLLIRKI